MRMNSKLIAAAVAVADGSGGPGRAGAGIH